MDYTNAAEHLRFASLVAKHWQNAGPFRVFADNVPSATRDMPLHLLPLPMHLPSATGAGASLADKRAMLRVMIDSEARESDYTLAWFCAACHLGEECCALAETGVHTLAQLRTFYDSNAELPCPTTRLRDDRLRALCQLVSYMFTLYEGASPNARTARPS